MVERADNARFEKQEDEEKGQSQVDFVVEPLSEEDLEGVSGGGCNNCVNGCNIE